VQFLQKTVRECIERFDDAWEDNPPPEIDAFYNDAIACGGEALNATAHRDILITLIMSDLAHRWAAMASAGKRTTGPTLYDYAKRYPDLGGPDDWPAELILTEFESRKRWGDRPEIGQYLSPFVLRQRELLPKLKQIDASLAACEPPRFPDYDIESEIGRGGFGVVYKAWQQSLGRTVALKVWPASLARNDDVWSRLQDEARLLAMAQHSNIVKIYATCKSDDYYFHVLEYIDGGALSGKIGKLKSARQTANVPEVVSMMMALADVLQHVHDMGIIHGDIKPGNILLHQADEHGRRVERVKLTDFGLAYVKERVWRATKQVFGTPEYMSPEQAAGKLRLINHTSDIFSLGVVMYEMLTCRSPFRGFTWNHSCALIARNNPPPIRSLNQKVPRDLAHICLKCLETEQRDRFRDAAELRDELGRFIRCEPLKTKRTSVVDRTAKWFRRTYRDWAGAPEKFEDSR
jgi:serine/threonine protein kinase